MKNFGLFSLIILFTNLSNAGTMEQSYGPILKAWAAQTGVEIELANSGNYVFERYVREQYRTPLAVSVQIAEAIRAGRIQINYKWSF